MFNQLSKEDKAAFKEVFGFMGELIFGVALLFFILWEIMCGAYIGEIYL